MSILAVALFCGQSDGIELGSDQYMLPLVGRYAVHRDGLSAPDVSAGRYRLVEVNARVPWSWEGVVENVEQVAVWGHIIVGTTKGGYFILDASSPDAAPMTSGNVYADAEEWRKALKVAGVPPDIRLNRPDSMTVGMGDMQLHPIDYRLMHGKFGWADDEWAGVVEVAGLIFIFVLGLKIRSSTLLLVSAIVVGLLVDFIAEMILIGGGPGSTVGLVGFPVIYGLAGALGRLLGKRIWKNPRRERTASSRNG